jgi:TonB family protein
MACSGRAMTSNLMNKGSRAPLKPSVGRLLLIQLSVGANMKKHIFTITAFSILLGIPVEPRINAQNRRRRARSPPAITMNGSSEEIDPGTPEERAKIIEECSAPDRPRPEATVKTPVLCGKAISLPKPPYPEGAKAAKASGTVTVAIVIDEKGRVVWAQAVSGHPLLQGASVKAACRARYSPTKLSGQAVRANSVITYNYVSQ